VIVVTKSEGVLVGLSENGFDDAAVHAGVAA
jgi:hypothetical protein